MNKKALIILVLALLVAAVCLIVYFKSKSNEKESDGSISGPEPFPLKYGSRGPEVGQLQKYLINEFGAKISPDGRVDEWWGDMTEEAVKTFLQRNNVSASIYYKFKMDKY